MTPDDHDPDTPDGWAVHEHEDNLRSWVGDDKRVLCTTDGDSDEWTVSLQPRGELGASHEVPLTDGPTSRDQALAVAREYMEGNAEHR